MSPWSSPAPQLDPRLAAVIRATFTMSQPPTDSPTPSGQPSREEVFAELARILGSQCFEQAGRSREFLRFVVEQTLAGAADRLKGYTIAIEVFGRPVDFDAQSDPLVRVEAGRLRRRLLEYYVAEGYANPLRIELPRGGYTPEFRYMEPLPAEPVAGSGAPLPPAQSPEAAPEPQPSRRARRRLRSVAVLATMIVLASLLAVQWLGPRLDAGSRRALALPSGPKILVLPFENLSGDPSIDYVTDGVTEEIMLKLSAFNLFVIASQTTWYYRDAARNPQALSPDVDAPYVLTGSVRTTPDRVRIAARLFDRGTGAQLWTDAYDEDLSVATLLAIQEKIANEVAATIAAPYGPIYEQELARVAHKPAESLDTYDCVLKYYSYRRTFDPTLHRETVTCFETAVVREPMFADAWAGLALMYLDEHVYGYTPQSAAAGPLERAREAARNALDIDGENYFANLALARVRFFSGDLEGFSRSADRVLALDANNTEALSLIGTLLAISGSSERAQPLVNKALALSPRAPGYYYLAQAVMELRAGRDDAALNWALRIDAPNWFVTPLIVAASAGLAQRQDVAARATARLLELYPDFAREARFELAKWQVDPPLLDKILRGLRAAGLDVV
jgi:adenylate cyclase